MGVSNIQLRKTMYADTDYLPSARILPPLNNNNLRIPNNNPIDITTNSIGEFYRGTKVFITGATGFVGKALLEKLLRSCDQIETVYVLMRPKRGLNVEQRLVELLENPVFGRVKEKRPEVFEKIKVVCGDVTQPVLGLSERDRRILTENVDIVFHSAATVKFNENLKNAIVLNTLGTRRILEFCCEMINLKSFVHVSTAFSNSDKREIEEIVYPPPHDPNCVINCVDALPSDALDVLAKRLIGKHPNTYTLSKAMAEHIVHEFSGDIPTAIVRPSIVTASWREPFPGWVDNVSGITGIMMEIGRGTIKSIVCDENLLMDLIPVDIVVNTLITAAWHTIAYRSNTMRVYNCTSGQMNGISWKDYRLLTYRYALEYPSKYVTLYPGFTYTTNRLTHWFHSAIFHYLPAFALDVFLYCTRHKPIMLSLCRKFARAAKTGEFFALNEWNFQNTNMCNLAEALTTVKDGDEFPMDIRDGFEWDPYVKAYMLGIRQYVLKDDLSSLKDAKIKLNRLYWLNKFVQATSMYLLLRLAIQ